MLNLLLFLFLIILGFLLMVGYFYIDVWIYPKVREEKAKKKKMGWLAMLTMSLAVFSFSLAWMVRVPSVREFFPIFLIMSLIIGLLGRESTKSPYELADFWAKFIKNKRGKNR